MAKPLIVIAIDGYSSCGKSTLAKALATHLNYKYLDSGAMYRAVTLYCLRHNINISKPSQVINSLTHINISFAIIKGKNRTLLNNEDVEDDIRSMPVSKNVSEVSAIPQVREKLVATQQNLGKAKGIVMEGRDITTVVFPEAELKLFVTADVETRTERRYQELLQKGKKITREEVRNNLKHRDYIDTTRTHSPLIQHPDAYVLDNTYLNRDEQIEVVLAYYEYLTK